LPNQGIGTSRNLGIEKAKCELIAFLDADGYYLPDCFQKNIAIASTGNLTGEV
jgi:glycosyltransferase involved in cell wall biosynthesis